MPAPPALMLAGQAASSRSVRYLLGAVVTLPVLFIVMLLMLLTAGASADAKSARLAGAVLRPGAVPIAYDELIRRAAQTCPGITGALLAAQVQAESAWNPDARSPAGAQGLAQFMPGTWLGEGVDGDGDGVRDPFSPADAIASQAGFMCRLLAAVGPDDTLAGDRIELALAAYNAGLEAVRRHRGVPPYTETQGYVQRIRALAGSYAAPTGPTPGVAGAGDWVHPVKGAPVTSGFGQRWGRLHTGTDFAAPVGTAVLAASAGTVSAAGPASGFGQWVKLRHPGGVSTVYGHVSRVMVTVGQAVAAGELIAYSGNEGRSTGPHLHLEVHVGGRPVDPVAFYTAHAADPL